MDQYGAALYLEHSIVVSLPQIVHFHVAMLSNGFSVECKELFWKWVWLLGSQLDPWRSRRGSVQKVNGN
jgi:hypothetical protein